MRTTDGSASYTTNCVYLIPATSGRVTQMRNHKASGLLKAPQSGSVLEKWRNAESKWSRHPADTTASSHSPPTLPHPRHREEATHHPSRRATQTAIETAEARRQLTRNARRPQTRRHRPRRSRNPNRQRPPRRAGKRLHAAALADPRTRPRHGGPSGLHGATRLGRRAIQSSLTMTPARATRKRPERMSPTNRASLAVIVARARG